MKKWPLVTAVVGLGLAAVAGLAAYASRRPTVPSLAKGPGYAEAAALVERVVAAPAAYRQICSPRRLEGRGPLFLPYQFFRPNDQISAAQYALLREQREAVLQSVCNRLPEVIDEVVADWALDNEGKSQAVSPEGAIDYRYQHYLAILLDLNAAQSLPTLLGLLEKRLLGPEFNLPRGDVLSTITGILRQERYAPLLASTMEQDYRTWLKQVRGTMKQEELGWRVDAIPLERRAFFAVDPLLGEVVPLGHRLYNLRRLRHETELTPELEAQIVGWARDFLATTPPNTWLGPDGMLSWPVSR